MCSEKSRSRFVGQNGDELHYPGTEGPENFTFTMCEFLTPILTVFAKIEKKLEQ